MYSKEMKAERAKRKNEQMRKEQALKNNVFRRRRVMRQIKTAKRSIRRTDRLLALTGPSEAVKAVEALLVDNCMPLPVEKTLEAQVQP